MTSRATIAATLSSRRSDLPTPYPIGVDRRNGTISFAVVRSDAQRPFHFERAATVTVPAGNDAATLERIFARFSRHQKRCVLSLPPGEATIIPWPRGNRVPEPERLSAAHLEIDPRVDIPRSDRVIRIERTPNGTLFLLVSSTQTCAAALEVARAAHLDPSILEVPAVAWTRVFPGGIIDDIGPTPFLATRSSGIPLEILLPAHTDPEHFAESVRHELLKVRETHHLEADNFAYWGDPHSDRLSALQHALADLDLHVEPLVVAGRAAPPWAFAYALATWSLP